MFFITFSIKKVKKVTNGVFKEFPDVFSTMTFIRPNSYVRKFIRQFNMRAGTSYFEYVRHIT